MPQIFRGRALRQPMLCCCVNLRGVVPMGKTQLALTEYEEHTLKNTSVGVRLGSRTKNYRNLGTASNFRVDPVHIIMIMRLMEKCTSICFHFVCHRVGIWGMLKKIVYSVKNQCKKRISCCPSKNQGMGSSDESSDIVGDKIDLKTCHKSKTRQMVKLASKRVKVMSGEALPPLSNSVAVHSIPKIPAFWFIPLNNLSKYSKPVDKKVWLDLMLRSLRAGKRSSPITKVAHFGPEILIQAPTMHM